MTLHDFLEQLQGEFEAVGTDGLEGERRRRAPLPDGSYECQIVGVGWRDGEAASRGGWQGMGVELRARVIRGSEGVRGRYLRVVFWLVYAHPSNGINSPRVRAAGVQALKRACSALDVLPPARLSEAASWSAALGELALIRLVTREANRQSRSSKRRETAIVSRVDPRQPLAEGWQPYPAEYLGTDGCWVPADQPRPDR